MAGGSARHEFERRSTAREQRIRARHPRLGGLILAVSDDPQTTKAWAVGAQGEERLGARLDAVAGPMVRVLHDRRIPRTPANIDHLVTCASGVYVVDAKQYRDSPQLRVEGGFLRERTEKLVVGSRDWSTLVDGVLRQVALVRDALGDDTVPIRGVLCFVAADWPLFGGAFTTRDVTVVWPKTRSSQPSSPDPAASTPTRSTPLTTAWPEPSPPRETRAAAMPIVPVRPGARASLRVTRRPCAWADVGLPLSDGSLLTAI